MIDTADQLKEMIIDKLVSSGVMKHKMDTVSSGTTFSPDYSVDFDIEIGDKLFSIQITDFTQDREDYLNDVENENPNSRFFDKEKVRVHNE